MNFHQQNIEDMEHIIAQTLDTDQSSETVKSVKSQAPEFIGWETSLGTYKTYFQDIIHWFTVCGLDG